MHLTHIIKLLYCLKNAIPLMSSNTILRSQNFLDHTKPNKHSTSKSVYSHALAVVLFHLILLIRNMSSPLESRTTFLS